MTGVDPQERQQYELHAGVLRTVGESLRGDLPPVLAFETGARGNEAALRLHAPELALRIIARTQALAGPDHDDAIALEMLFRMVSEQLERDRSEAARYTECAQDPAYHDGSIVTRAHITARAAEAHERAGALETAASQYLESVALGHRAETSDTDARRSDISFKTVQREAAALRVSRLAGFVEALTQELGIAQWPERVDRPRIPTGVFDRARWKPTALPRGDLSR